MNYKFKTGAIIQDKKMEHRQYKVCGFNPLKTTYRLMHVGHKTMYNSNFVAINYLYKIK